MEATCCHCCGAATLISRDQPHYCDQCRHNPRATDRPLPAKPDPLFRAALHQAFPSLLAAATAPTPDITPTPDDHLPDESSASIALDKHVAAQVDEETRRIERRPQPLTAERIAALTIDLGTKDQEHA